MQRTPERPAQFDRDGYLFSPQEPQILLEAVPSLCERRAFIPGIALKAAA